MLVAAQSAFDQQHSAIFEFAITVDFGIISVVLVCLLILNANLPTFLE